MIVEINEISVFGEILSVRRKTELFQSGGPAEMCGRRRGEDVLTSIVWTNMHFMHCLSSVNCFLPLPSVQSNA